MHEDESAEGPHDHHAVYGRLRALMQQGRSDAALAEARRIAARASAPVIVAQALAFELGAMLNVADLTGYAPVLDRAFALLDEVDDATVAGELHAIAGSVACLHGALERCVRHFEYSRRHLVTAPDWVGAADAWYDLALGCSQAGLHDQALDAVERANALYSLLGLSDEETGAQIRVRHAVAVDHRGDTATAVRLLRQVVDDFGRGPAPAWSVDRAHIAYAAARLAALGCPGVPDLGGLLDGVGHDVDERTIRALTPVCAALAAGNGDAALALLDTAPVHHATFGVAEVHRLGALAHSLAGRLPLAIAAERAASRAVHLALDPLSALFVDGVAARIDHENLRRVADRYADAALTDPLTGLPNRRGLHEYVTGLLAVDTPAVVGVADLNGFKAVNDRYGHLAGDLVLQRLAGVLTREVGHGFAARYGGDEFVLVLPGVDLSGARATGGRIHEAVAAEDWNSLVPDSALNLAIGWAHLTETGLTCAIDRADRAMYQMKARTRGR
ncbi:GGDEF domain-containing protein [Longispora sp. K20-0274]|uniref:diguanylate cyclase domain-containing protein n=1 Tax=Longispora sp. K20-0274 TaxID=3088255 RepID=UPI0039995044